MLHLNSESHPRLVVSVLFPLNLADEFLRCVSLLCLGSLAVFLQSRIILVKSTGENLSQTVSLRFGPIEHHGSSTAGRGFSQSSEFLLLSSNLLLSDPLP